ncbi:MAG: Photosystem I assembly protein Ycf3 [Candidatus Omnitrophica bacterium]|nr:Photosystem I assembly protein Ycf3 [Candidatus Omnitrophota bacterium]
MSRRVPASPKKMTAPPKTSSAPPIALWVVLAVALAARVVYHHLSRTSPSYEPLLLDPAYYHRWALRIIGGDWVGEGVFYGLPLYPFFLAAVLGATGLSLTAVKAVQILLGVASLFFVYRTGERLGGRSAGLLAAAAGALYGPLMFYEGLLIPEALGAVLYAAGLYLVVRHAEAPTVRTAVKLGVVTGLAALTKAGLLLFVPACALWDRKRTRGWKVPLTLVAATAAMILPVTAHNAWHGKDRVLLSSHSGFNLYVGNNPAAEGTFATPPGVGTNVESQERDARRIAEQARGRRLKPSEVSAFWSDKAWDYIRSHPLETGLLWLRKLALFLDAREISDVQDYDFEKQFNPMLRLPWVDFGWIAPFLFAGAVYAWRAGSAGRGVVVWLVTYAAAVCLYFVNARYRLPVLPAALVLAAYGATRLAQDLRSRRWPAIVLALVVGASGAWVSQLRLVGTAWTHQWVNAGDAYLNQQRFAESERCYRNAIEIDPRFAKAHLALGILMNKQGAYDRAKDHFMDCLAIEPHEDALNNVGLWYDSEGDDVTAERYFRQALELRETPQAHNNLGMVYGKRGQNAEALKHFERSLELNPDSARAWTNRGLVLYRLGRRPEAVESWRRALAIDPAFGEARKAMDYIEATQGRTA